MRNRFYLIVLLCATSSAGFVSSAHAGFLDGQSLELRYDYPNNGTLYYGPVFFTVGPGVEATEVPNSGGFDVDVSDSNILLTFLGNPNPSQNNFGSAAFNGPRFIDYTSSIPAFGDAIINPATTLSGFDASRVSVTADEIDVNLEGLSYNPGDEISLDVSPAPEPTTLMLGLGGFASMVAFQKLRRKNTGQ
jgi:hypothetical protein